MIKASRRESAKLHAATWFLWAVVAVSGAVWLAHSRLQELRAAFETDGRIAHRRLSQRVVQHDAVISTLALLQPSSVPTIGAGANFPPALARLSSVYPQIPSVLQRTEEGKWPAALQIPLAKAEAASRRSGRPEMALIDLPAGRYHLVMASTPASYALNIDLRATVPYNEWPMDMDSSPVRVILELGGAAFVVQSGPPHGVDFGWTYTFHKRLTIPSQPLDVVARRTVSPRELPWFRMLGWCVLTGMLWAGSLGWRRQRASRRRGEELLRLNQVAKLNTLGELAAGMAHELNQPLTALLSSAQAAQRLLAKDPPDLSSVQTAIVRAVEQARRASSVVRRLRRLVERPELAQQVRPLPLGPAVQEVLRLLEPELERGNITPTICSEPALPLVLADPVALQQIVHNLLMNALHALSQVPPAERQLRIVMRNLGARHVALSVCDHGPGVRPEARPHLFEPFYTTRSGGLGLGLTLCESLAQAMGAQLVLTPDVPLPTATGRGAEFVLTLAAAP
ncbi:sensor histidine kinase [Duganella radicis]|uniref:histidine kinase n=1 Tax=Duganella radicis TaxID=551988 RepID=A0A6L6PBP9_9BURK|nr:ATP-binding protein [Duganella radicis]MTV36001.1 two-component sensor histidine kinase [Duganella radicis]